MSNFDDYLKEQLEDPELRAEYEALELEFSLMQATIDARRDTDCRHHHFVDLGNMV